MDIAAVVRKSVRSRETMVEKLRYLEAGLEKDGLFTDITLDEDAGTLTLSAGALKIQLQAGVDGAGDGHLIAGLLIPGDCGPKFEQVVDQHVDQIGEALDSPLDASSYIRLKVGSLFDGVRDRKGIIIGGLCVPDARW